MVLVACKEDPNVYAKFDCALDAEVYYEVAKDSLPEDSHLVILDSNPGSCCQRCDRGCNSLRIT